MADPLAYRALAAVIARLQTIQVANGFYTDAGLHVFLGRRLATFDELGADEAIVVDDGLETPTTGSGLPTYGDIFNNVLRIEAEGHVRGDMDDTGRRRALLRSDIKRAVMGGPLSDATSSKFAYLRFAGADRLLRDAGDDSEATNVSFEACWREKWGDPTASS